MAAWLNPSSGKKRDTHDIRDFITVHGKIVKTSSPAVLSDYSKHAKNKQITLDHCHGQKHDRETEAPATRFSTGVRKKAAFVDLKRQDCQEQPFTDSIKENVSPRQCEQHGNTLHVKDPRKARKRTHSGSLAESTNAKHPPKYKVASLSAKKHLCRSTSRDCGQSATSKRAKLVSQWDETPTAYKSSKTQKNSSNPDTTAECKPLQKTPKVYMCEDALPPPLGEKTIAVECSCSATTAVDSVGHTTGLELFDSSETSPDDVNLPLASSYVENSGSNCISCLGVGSSNGHSLDDQGDTDDLLAELSMYEKILLDQP